ncbi:MAG: DUF3788 family protein [Oscillospiraceae bacterium]|nr:DUF3788 family protein [Oscillospiraceae bacterium]
MTALTLPTAKAVGSVNILVAVSEKEKTFVKEILPDCVGELQAIYRQTQEGNGQRWLMIDLEEKGRLYNDLLRLIQIRRNCSSSRKGLLPVKSRRQALQLCLDAVVV